MEIENQEIENIETPEIEDQTETEESPEGEAEPEGYTPNLKYKVGDQEKEFDERIRGNIKSKEDEDYFRDLFTKADGLDIVKARQAEKEKTWQSRESEFSQLKTTHDRVQNSLQKLNALKSEDFTLFQKAWEIPDKAVLERARQILEVHGDPQAQARAEKAVQDRLQVIQYEDRVNQETHIQGQMQRQLHEMKLTQAMANPDVTKFAQEYDRRLGQPGAFQEEVNKLGTLAFHSGQYLDPQVAVMQAHQKLSRLVSFQAETPASVPPAQAKQPAPKPALPNMGSGRTGTATSRKITSIKDLRKLAQSME